LKRQRVPDTGEWFWQSVEDLNWISGSGQSLICRGIRIAIDLLGANVFSWSWEVVHHIRFSMNWLILVLLSLTNFYHRPTAAIRQIQQFCSFISTTTIHLLGPQRQSLVPFSSNWYTRWTCFRDYSNRSTINVSIKVCRNLRSMCSPTYSSPSQSNS
jgi:hypothetical protein